MTDFTLGAQGPEVKAFQEFMNRKFSSYSTLPVDSYYGNHDRDVVNEAKRRLGLPQDGIADEAFLVRVGFRAGNLAPQSSTWWYSAAGTFVRWWVGPPFLVGQAMKQAGRNHQPVDYPAGGFFTGDPSISYLDSITILRNEFVRCVLQNPTGNIGVIGYSQSADGLIRACDAEFGEGGRLAHRRDDLKRIITFGSPVRPPGATALSGTPPGSGIARWYTPDWLRPLTTDILLPKDMYGCARDDTLIPDFYPIFIRAETELPFVLYLFQVILPEILTKFGLGGLMGGILGQPMVSLLALTAGVNPIGLATLMTGISRAPAPDPQVVAQFNAFGALNDVARLIRTFQVLIEFATDNDHVQYESEPAFAGRTGLQVAIEEAMRIP